MSSTVSSPAASTSSLESIVLCAVAFLLTDVVSGLHGVGALLAAVLLAVVRRRLAPRRGLHTSVRRAQLRRRADEALAASGTWATLSVAWLALHVAVGAPPP